MTDDAAGADGTDARESPSRWRALLDRLAARRPDPPPLP